MPVDDVVGYCAFARAKVGGSIGCFFRHGQFFDGELVTFGELRPMYLNNGGLFLANEADVAEVGKLGWGCSWVLGVPWKLSPVDPKKHIGRATSTEQFLTRRGPRRDGGIARCIVEQEVHLRSVQGADALERHYLLSAEQPAFACGVGRVAIVCDDGRRFDGGTFFFDLAAHAWLDALARKDRSIRWVPVRAAPGA